MAIDWTGFAFGKGDPLGREKARDDREYAAKREACRAFTFDRAGGCCERCGVPLKLRPSEARHEYEIANINEEPRRSRGGDPTNPRDCTCLCYRCHWLVTHRWIAIRWKDEEKKALGGCVFEALRESGTAHGRIASRYVE